MTAPNSHIRGVVKDILLAFVVSSVPLVAFSAVLLGLIFAYRVIPSSPVLNILGPTSSENDGSVIYVDLSATALITVASWSSTMAPITLSFILTLMSFPVVKVMIKQGVSSARPRLLTPYQFALLIRILCNSSLSSVWCCVKYIISWRKRAPMAKPLVPMVWMLFLSTLLSFFVFATDTWLHFTTKTVSLTQYSQTTFNDASFGLLQNCTNLNHSFGYQCNLNPAAATTFLIDAGQSLDLLANVSSTSMVRPLTDGVGNNGYAYLGLPLGRSNNSVDYIATSLAVHTQCVPATKRCFNSSSPISGPGANYTCDFAMKGFITTDLINTMATVYFMDATLNSSLTGNISMPNPYYFATVVSVNQNLGRNQDILNDPDITSGLHGSTLFVLLCSATVLDFRYTSVNGAITYASSQKSNSSTTNVIMGTQAYTRVGDGYILQRTSLDVWQSHSANEIAAKFANTYSQTALAAAGSAFDARPAITAQSRSSILVAKVPKAPLACLLAANLALAFLGITLAIIALLVRDDDVGDVQARLNIPALVAAQFETDRGQRPVEKIDDMFDEFQGCAGTRIEAARTASGYWRFQGHQ